MNPIVLAALLTIVPTDPPALDNGFPVAVTAVQLARANGGTRTLPRIDAGRSVRLRGDERIVSFELDSCPAESRSAILAADPTAKGACWRALQRASHALATAPASATVDLQAVLLGTTTEPAALARAAANVLPELVTIEVEGGAIGTEVGQALVRLQLGSMNEQLRQVPRDRRADMLTALSLHEDGRAFGQLVRAALHSVRETERRAASRALADYPDDAVARLSNALEDPSALIRQYAAEALRSQDARAVSSLHAALRALGEEPAAADAPPSTLADHLIATHERLLTARTSHLRAEAEAALERGDLPSAIPALTQLAATDREAYRAMSALRARAHLLAARDALDATGRLDDRGLAAYEDLASAYRLDPNADGLAAIALGLGELLQSGGAAASATIERVANGDAMVAAMVLGGDTARRVSDLRDEVTRDEVRLLVETGQKETAHGRLLELENIGHRDALAKELDDELDIRASGMWITPASLGLFLSSIIGFAVRRERRRRRGEFQLIDSENARSKFHEGVYR